MGRKLAEGKIWKYFIQLCLAIESLHDKNILHRDIKSKNIFLSQEDDVKLGDLGIAKVLPNENCRAYVTVGTLYYLSPEVC